MRSTCKPSAACAQASCVTDFVCVCLCVCARVLYGPDDGAPALRRQPVLILWPPPQLQHVGNKPFSSNLQTVQQSMGNYLSQSMGRPFCFSLSLSLLLSLSVSPFSPPPSLSLSSSLLSHFCCLPVFSAHSFTRPPFPSPHIPSSSLSLSLPL